jgi:hypothetical protein
VESKSEHVRARHGWVHGPGRGARRGRRSRRRAREKKLNFFQRIALFIRQVFGELRKVVTPTRQELSSSPVSCSASSS